MLGTYFDRYMNFSFPKIKHLGLNYDPKKSFLDDYDYDDWYEELDDKTLKKLDDKTKKLDDTASKKCHY